jgi:hypothetical protein
MKLIKLVIPFLFLQSLLLSCKSNTYTYNDDIPAGIIEAIKAGNARELAKYFQNSVELALTDIDDVYSKNQAELIIQDFFKKHPPQSFSILHKGGKETSRYAIGNLSTANGKFRVTILIKIREGVAAINQLRIEKEDGE